jgi:hypothetical protein
VTWKTVLKELADIARSSADKLTKTLPDGATSKSNIIKTTNLRVDVHQDSKDVNKALARVQANAGATDSTVKDYIKSGNKGSGGHKGTHKVIAEIPFDRTAFDAEDFASKIEETAQLDVSCLQPASLRTRHR